MLSFDELLALQNSDGGWGYSSGHTSWTEPTCYALLALASTGQAASPQAVRGSQWLSGLQRTDGGFSPHPSVSETTWQTALVLNLPSELSTHIDKVKAEAWLLEQTGRESGWLNRVRMMLSGVKQDVSVSYDGWPWFPGAAAWVTPTAISILALAKVARAEAPESEQGKKIRTRLEEGRAFLLARRCRDGGWNHGSTKALGYDSDSYPETTGTALLALSGVSAAEIEKDLRRAEEHLAACKSNEAASWLTLGLLAHGKKPVTPDVPAHSGTMSLAMAILANSATEGRNIFLA